ncbi:MAG: M28 family peptidase [Kiritimatiellaeota bacterium]|nr:M28 family peptidase [Kiritimatiellota bacterium]
MELQKASAELLERHLRELTEHIGIRLAGSENERRAAAYLDKIFRRYAPSSRIEKFPVWERTVKAERLEIKINGKWKTFPCSLFGSAPGTGGKSIAGDLCFFVSAVDYQRKDISYLKGKAVVHLGCHIENESDYRRLMQAQPAFLLFVDTRYPANAALADGLFPSYVAKFGAKPTVNVAYMDAWSWKQNGATEAKLRIEGDRKSSFSRNVIAEIPGTEPGCGIIFAGGHHDTQAGSVGADDNATGSVALLELARILSGLKLKRTVRLISFGAEEQLSMGSAEYVRVHRNEIERSGVFMFNLDSYGSLMGWTEVNYNGDKAIERLLKSCFKRQNIYVHYASGVVPYTDQFAFAAAGVPGLWVYRKNCEAGRFFHHRHDDTVKMLSMELIARHINAAAEFISNLADAETMPFKKKIPDKQAAEIRHNWESLFGGWQGF